MGLPNFRRRRLYSQYSGQRDRDGEDLPTLSLRLNAVSRLARLA